MNILITGNRYIGLAAALYNLYPDATFVSRQTGFDLTTQDGIKKLLGLINNFDIIINSSALWKFQQTVLLDQIYKKCVELNHRPHIINLGSTTDRVKNGKVWLYNAEKKALRDYSNTLGITGVWNNGPKISYISFGTLSNNQDKHVDRKCINIDLAASYIKWLIDQPKEICINEISIDPIQYL